MATIMFIDWNSARSESNVVMVPAPATKGNAIGTIEADVAFSSLYNRIPKIISRAKKNNTNEPATANELTSIPINFSISSPTKRKAIIIPADAKDAFPD